RNAFRRKSSRPCKPRSPPCRPSLASPPRRRLLRSDPSRNRRPPPRQRHRRAPERNRRPAPAPAAPAPPKPAAVAAAAASSDEARAIETDVARTLMFAAEDVERDPDRAESRIERALTRLDSPEAKQHLPADLMAKLRAQVAELRAKMEGGRQAEKIGRMEEQFTRFLGSAQSHVDERPWMAE